MHHLHNIVSREVTVDRVGDKVAYGAFKSGFIAVGSSDPIFDSGVDGGHVFVQTPVEAAVERRPGPSETRLEPHECRDNLVDQYLHIVSARDDGYIGGDVFAHTVVAAGVDAGLKLLLPHVAEGDRSIGLTRLEVSSCR